MVQIKVRVSEATNTQLDWMVAVCKHEATRHKYGTPTFDPKTKRIYETEGLRQIGVNFAPTADWSQGGPIIENAVVSLGVEDGGWRALCWGTDGPNRELYSMRGTTPLIAAMRCYVVSRLGEEVEIPEELK